ncbi:unnamed protein product, partial [Rotaria magnacalcarata]
MRSVLSVKADIPGRALRRLDTAVYVPYYGRILPCRIRHNTPTDSNSYPTVNGRIKDRKRPTTA